MAFNDPVGGKVLGSLLSSILGGSLDNGWDPRVQSYYNKHGDSIFAAANGASDPNADLYGATLKAMQADPETASLFQTPKAQVTGAAGGQQTPDRSAADAAANAAANAAALTKANTSTDLAGENKNLTIAGGSADAASSVDESGKKKRSPTGLASSLGINV
jgi:hypothetical protein